jgi:hypothetical protein
VIEPAHEEDCCERSLAHDCQLLLACARKRVRTTEPASRNPHPAVGCSDSTAHDRRMHAHAYDEAKLALGHVRDDVYEPALVQRNTAAQRVSMLNMRLRGLDGVIDQRLLRVPAAGQLSLRRPSP